MISESSVRSCEVGLLECGENAECVPKQNSKSKVGVCQCIEGFVFDTGGTCVETSVETKTEKTVIIQFLGGMFLFLLFLHFHSFSSFSPVLFHLLYYLFYLPSPCFWEMTQNDPQWLTYR